MEKVNHPLHYGGKDNPYEAIKVIEAWDLGFNLGNVVKYISRAGKKGDNYLEDLRKAKAYIEFEISKAENFATTSNNLRISGDDIERRYKKGDVVISLYDLKPHVCSGSFMIMNNDSLTVWDSHTSGLLLHKNGLFAAKFIKED